MRRTKPTPKIAIRNRQRALRLDPRVVRRVVVEAFRLSTLGSRLSTSDLSLVFVTDAEIAALNEQFLGHTGPTDIITFHHGEIAISTERAVAQSKQFRTTVADELALYLIHGLLHLAGHDDLKPGPRRVMQREQRRILGELRKTLDLRKLLR